MTTRLPESGFASARETVATAMFHGRIGSSCPMITTERGGASAASPAVVANAKPRPMQTPATAAARSRPGIMLSAHRARRVPGGRRRPAFNCHNMARTTVLVLVLGSCHGLRNRLDQQASRERLAEIGDAARCPGLLARRLIIKRRHEEDRQPRALCGKLVTQHDPRHSAEMNIKNSTVDCSPGISRKKGFRRCKCLSPKAVRVQQPREALEEVRIVVDDRDGP